MNAVDLYTRCDAAFRERLAAVDGRWAAPTALPGWDVRALVHHMVVEERWAPPIFAGLSIGEVGDIFEGDQLVPDPLTAARDASGAVDARGFQQLVRHGHEELAEQQRAGRGCDQRQDQPGIGVEHLQVGHHLVGRIDADFDRQHQRDKDDPERRLAERKAEIHHGIGRQDRDENLADAQCRSPRQTN